MKVFACKSQETYGGGLILVAANTKEEAFNTAADAAKDDCWLPFYECRHRDGSCTIESDEYPFDEWFEVKHLSTDLTEPKVIIEDHYSE